MRLSSPNFPWYLRPLRWAQRLQHGRPLEPTHLWAHRPRLLFAFLQLHRALRSQRGLLPAGLRTLVALQVSQQIGCAFCADLNASLLPGEVDPATPVGSRPGCLRTPRERVALEYADAMTRTPPVIGDELFARLRSQFDAEAIVELTAVIAFQNMSARFNTALDARPHGFCARPAPPVAASAVAASDRATGAR